MNQIINLVCGNHQDHHCRDQMDLQEGGEDQDHREKEDRLSKHFRLPIGPRND